MSRERLRILFVASEVEPFAKTGGLADVTGALPQALEALGHDVRVILPRVPRRRAGGRRARAGPAAARGAGRRPDRSRARSLEGRTGRAIPVYFVAQDHYYDRPSLYGTHEGDYPDNCERFVFFCRARHGGPAAARTGRRTSIHAHDWQTGLIPVYLRDPLPRRAVLPRRGHRLHHPQPRLPGAVLALRPADDRAGLGPLHAGRLEFYGKLNLLKGGLVFADLLTTVSPTYAREIQTPAYGEGLDGVLRERSADLVGILNGIDHEAWNPATRRRHPEALRRRRPEGKAACKAALREELGLAGPGTRRRRWSAS